MGKGGGTRIYCPHCKEVKVCTVDSFFQENKSSQTWTHKKFADLHWFERGRICTECNKNFVTVEVNSKLIDELISYRELIPEIFEKLKKQLIGSEDMISNLAEVINALSTPANAIRNTPEYVDPIEEILSKFCKSKKDEIK